ncbi:4-hydroxy-tetrahydrodipicolinate reductase [Isobaculum melis]|uniref:4-hydroxy-tetrahydrodipicolinate reductase n=1 Tax=Isobaculum melis TaxID=142588 RepID=A0A1H9RAJ7_9LACT|nr:4-hydroxy-tetrahydrodipicolinate reductase [Isobaculum melis]SER69079.1 dihydrodipicolinate reductase [Isobaculum melis]
MIKVIVAGYQGKMGSTATKMVLSHTEFELVAVLDPHAEINALWEDAAFPDVNVPVFKKKEDLVKKVQADVWIDFTIPAVAYEHTRFALEHKIAPVVGTTGFTDAQVTELKAYAKAHKIGGLIAPNFAIGAVLMMQFAQKAAQYLPDVEIIELHHDQKLDAPSGTALKTAEMIAEVRATKKQGNSAEKELLPGARGADYEGMKIHSVRLPGLIAHQQVLFGGTGEGLTIRHDSYDRASFMSGVALGVKKVVALEEFIYGLENLL